MAHHLALWIVIAGLCVTALCVTARAQTPSRQITVYSSQTNYSLPVLERGGREYIGLFELLEPIGDVSAKLEGKRWKLRFGPNLEAVFTPGETKVKIRKQEVDLGGPFLMENGRGLVPLSPLPALLAELLPGRSVEFHAASRRLFLDKAEVRYSAEIRPAGAAAQLVLGFSSPVNPFLASEPGRLRLVFRHEPLRVAAGAENAGLGDKTITSIGYTEANGTAELTVNSSAPLIASFSADHKTITLALLPSPPPPSVAQARAPSAPIAAPVSPAAPQAAPQAAPAAPKFLVVIDPAHGGDDRGAALTDKLAEKDANLAFAHRLLKAFEAAGIAVRLLRDGDQNLSADQRAVMANAASPSLFITLHASGATRGVRVYTSRLAPERRTAAFVPWDTAQAGFVTLSQELAAAVTTELLKHDVPAAAMRTDVEPINLIAAPGFAIEIGPPAGAAEELNSPPYQQTLAAALVAVVTANRARLPHAEAAP